MQEVKYLVVTELVSGSNTVSLVMTLPPESLLVLSFHHSSSDPI